MVLFVIKSIVCVFDDSCWRQQQQLLDEVYSRRINGQMDVKIHLVHTRGTLSI